LHVARRALHETSPVACGKKSRRRADTRRSAVPAPEYFKAKQKRQPNGNQHNKGQLETRKG